MRNRILSALGIALVLSALPADAQQVADTVFSPKVGAPAFARGKGPVVLIDEAHHNFHTASGRYLPFARTLASDGYDVRPSRAPLSRSALEGAKVLVISNALAARNEELWELPTPSAFDSAEVASVRQWVSEGGSLLLIADHMPFPGAAQNMAAAFGVLMTNGFAFDSATESEGSVRFTRRDGSLADHPITRGRNAAERIDSVVSFTGQAFRLSGAGAPLLTLQSGMVMLMPQVAWQFSSLTPRLSATGMLQGAALQFGKGRVAVFGEAAMFSAQVSGPNREPMGMNNPVAGQNAQLLLNLMHWLSGLL